MTAFNDIDKAELYLIYADTRMEEMEALAEAERSEELNTAVDGYDDAMGMAIERIGKAKAIEALDKAGALDNIPDELPVPESVPAEGELPVPENIPEDTTDKQEEEMIPSEKGEVPAEIPVQKNIKDRIKDKLEEIIP